MSTKKIELEGLTVILDNLVYRFDPQQLLSGKPHIFIYFLTIQNLSDRRVTLLGRKWIIKSQNGQTQIVEGDKIVGQTPTLNPKESFSYHSYHLTDKNQTASGSFHGIDQQNNLIYVKIPSFDMTIPDSPA